MAASLPRSHEASSGGVPSRSAAVPSTRSAASAIARSRSSAPAGAVNCSPTGMPARSRPTGQSAATAAGRQFDGLHGRMDAGQLLEVATGTEVRRLPAGGNRIRTLGPTRPIVAAHNPTAPERSFCSSQAAWSSSQQTRRWRKTDSNSWSHSRLEARIQGSQPARVEVETVRRIGHTAYGYYIT